MHMKQSVFEIILGAIIIIAAGTFLFFGLQETGNAAMGDGYHIRAEFSKVGGLRKGDPVTISGVEIGRVNTIRLNQERYLAEVDALITSGIKIPGDSYATIASKGLLGGNVMAIDPGIDDENMLVDGGVITQTQAPQDLIDLLGKFIFTAQDNNKNDNTK